MRRFFSSSRFLSTLSLRRATAWRQEHPTLAADFYPRSPCGERHRSGSKLIDSNHFYPRSPCGERPETIPGTQTGTGKFLSTLSLRRATTAPAVLPGCLEFLSTLSLRRATPAAQGIGRGANHFYPRSPCGERPAPVLQHRNGQTNFYPRSPCGERRYRISAK